MQRHPEFRACLGDAFSFESAPISQFGQKLFILAAHDEGGSVEMKSFSLVKHLRLARQ